MGQRENGVTWRDVLGLTLWAITALGIHFFMTAYIYD